MSRTKSRIKPQLYLGPLQASAQIGRITAGQFEEALKFRSKEPTQHVSADQDKIRMAHYVPLHPRVNEAVEPLLDGKKGNEIMCPLSALNQWLWRSRQAGHEIPLSRCGPYLVLSDLRKFTEQHGDVIGWDLSNRAYILTHGVSGVEWSHYRNPLPENVYDIYVKYARSRSSANERAALKIAV